AGQGATTTTLPGTTTAASTTTVAGATTTEFPSSGTEPPTVAPAEEHPPPVHVIGPGEALPIVKAVVVVPGGKVVILGTLTPDQAEALERALGAQRAHTGANQTGPVAVGLVVLGVGCVLLSVATRRRGTPT